MSAPAGLTKTVALVGGGTMGADIAASFAACGWRDHRGDARLELVAPGTAFTVIVEKRAGLSQPQE